MLCLGHKYYAPLLVGSSVSPGHGLGGEIDLTRGIVLY